MWEVDHGFWPDRITKTITLYWYKFINIVDWIVSSEFS